MKPDAVVIGGGPAGSAAAIRLARSGRQVALYEKSRFPRPKLCGGFMSLEGLEDLDDLEVLEPLRRSSVRLVRTILATRTGRRVESALPAETLSVSREILDDLLLRQARRAGVDVHEGVDGMPHASDAELTVIASGRLSHLREQDPEQSGRLRSQTAYFGIQAFFDETDGITDQVELDLVESGYVGLARQIRGVNVCALTTPDTIRRWGPDLDAVLGHFMEENAALREHLRHAKRVSPWKAAGPVQLGIRQLSRGRTFYVGDAACVVDPFAGEGMTVALYSARILAHALTQTDTPASEAYARLWTSAIQPSLRWNAAARLIAKWSFLREPVMQMLARFPNGIERITELTRVRRLEAV